MSNLIVNKYAKADYEVKEEFEAGLVLISDEIKAIRANRVNLKGSYGKIFYSEGGKPELFIVGAHFHTTRVDPYRTRKLLIKKSELKSLIGQTAEKGLTIIPLSIYVKRGLAKIKLALARGRQLHDKREVIKKRDQDREAQQQLKSSFK